MAAQKGKVALITGASSGIGEGTAIHLAGLGVSLSLAGRNEDRLAAVVNRCIELGVTAIGTAGDITDDKYLNDLVEETVKTFGRLDILINNAGRFSPAPFLDSDMTPYDEAMAVNIRAPYCLTKVAAPHLIKTKGSVVNVSSVMATLQTKFAMPYSISKAAVDQMTRCSAVELAEHGVRVNAVSPGHVETPMVATAAGSPDSYEKFKQAMTTVYPLGRIGKVAEIAKTIAFLVSEDSSFITGHILKAGGGIDLVGFQSGSRAAQTGEDMQP